MIVTPKIKGLGLNLLTAIPLAAFSQQRTQVCFGEDSRKLAIPSRNIHAMRSTVASTANSNYTASDAFFEALAEVISDFAVSQRALSDLEIVRGAGLLRQSRLRSPKSPRIDVERTRSTHPVVDQ